METIKEKAIKALDGIEEVRVVTNLGVTYTGNITEIRRLFIGMPVAGIDGISHIAYENITDINFVGVEGAKPFPLNIEWHERGATVYYNDGTAFGVTDAELESFCNIVLGEIGMRKGL